MGFQTCALITRKDVKVQMEHGLTRWRAVELGHHQPIRRQGPGRRPRDLLHGQKQRARQFGFDQAYLEACL